MVSTYFIIMKKLLMLGGGFLQNFVIKKAREMGYYVFCLDADPNALGFLSANEHAVINIVDEEDRKSTRLNSSHSSISRMPSSA